MYIFKTIMNTLPQLVEHKQKFKSTLKRLNQTNIEYRSDNNIKTFNPFFTCYYLKLMGSSTIKVKRSMFDKCRYNGCKTYL